MGASNKVKQVLKYKHLTQKEFAELIETDSQQVRNALYRDVFTYSKLEAWMDALGVEIVFKDKKTGKVFRDMPED